MNTKARKTLGAVLGVLTCLIIMGIILNIFTGLIPLAVSIILGVKLGRYVKRKVSGVKPIVKEKIIISEVNASN